MKNSKTKLANRIKLFLFLIPHLLLIPLVITILYHINNGNVTDKKNEFSIGISYGSRYELTNVRESVEVDENGNFFTASWDNYKNSVFGFTFNYPSILAIDKVTESSCEEDVCEDDINSRVKIWDSLTIHAISSPVELIYPYDKGYPRILFKDPVETQIDGQTFYYIVSKIGTVEMIVSDYTFYEDTLWVKSVKKVPSPKGSYFISFENQQFPSEITDNDIDLLDEILESFKF